MVHRATTWAILHMGGHHQAWDHRQASQVGHRQARGWALLQAFLVGRHPSATLRQAILADPHQASLACLLLVILADLRHLVLPAPLERSRRQGPTARKFWHSVRHRAGWGHRLAIHTHLLGTMGRPLPIGDRLAPTATHRTDRLTSMEHRLPITGVQGGRHH